MQYDAIIIGAGAAGLFCAAEAGKRGRRVLLIDHASKIAQKIAISGGGRCNFTNRAITPQHYLSNNSHFCISALNRYTQHDFVKLVKKHKISYHEKTLGQLFCDHSSKQIIDMLINECQAGSVTIQTNTTIKHITKNDQHFTLTTHKDNSFIANSLVLATGGLSIPKIGATSFGYELAKQFGLNIIPTAPALVPFTLDPKTLHHLKPLSGISLPSKVTTENTSFTESLLFTHRGLSGPAILQLSSYWQPNTPISIDFFPEQDLATRLTQSRAATPKQEIHTILSHYLPKKLAQYLAHEHHYQGKIAEHSNQSLKTIATTLKNYPLTPNGTEGYRTAEVTKGGIDTQELSSKTFETKKVPNLYIIGELLDVTGHLGGYNFQWAWSSAHAAAQYI